ncbi:MAG: hypothetical protein IPL47_00415 [Phyllobacteriaceae bacterium]|nr:hypothetical protein [Phyllobacteriaceae bacterium]
MFVLDPTARLSREHGRGTDFIKLRGMVRSNRGTNIGFHRRRLSRRCEFRFHIGHDRRQPDAALLHLFRGHGSVVPNGAVKRISRSLVDPQPECSVAGIALGERVSYGFFDRIQIQILSARRKSLPRMVNRCDTRNQPKGGKWIWARANGKSASAKSKSRLSRTSCQTQNLRLRKRQYEESRHGA